MSLLDEDQAALITLLDPTASNAAATRTRLKDALEGLEFKIDVVAEGVHSVEQLQARVQEAAEGVQKEAAEALEKREREARERHGMGKVGIGDVLRSLSRVGQS